MKKFVTAAVAIALAFAASNASAQAEPGDLGMFADPAGTLTTAAPAAFAPQFLYAVAFDVPGDMLAFEVGVRGLQEIGATVLGATLAGPNPLNLGAGTDYIVGTGGCLSGQGAVALVAVNYLIFAPAPADSPVCVSGTTPTSFASGNPGWSDCANALSEFGVATDGGVYPDGCVILNATQDAPVSNEDSSFGALKAGF